MARKQKTAPIEDVMIAVSKLPWWAGLSLAPISYVILHAMAARPVMPAAVGPGQLGAAVTGGFITTVAMFGQFVFPLAFAFGAALSAVNAARQKKIYNNVAARKDVAALNDMGWQDFERLVSEYFRRNGFQVSREGGNGPDGGIDLVLRQKSETYLVQCKQWRAYKVGVQPVREFFGVMSSRGVAGGYFVTSGEYTEEAKTFAHGLNLTLIDGRKLRAMIDAVNNSAPVQKPLVEATAPACPKCGTGMVKRVARKGDNAGKEFWGCPTFPKCSGTRPLASTTNNEDIPLPVTPNLAPEKRTCPDCGGELQLRQFQSGPKAGQQFYGCVPCKKGWPVTPTVSTSSTQEVAHDIR